MSKTHYVYSTLANDQRYIDWSKPSSEGALPVAQGDVVIKGGFGVANDRLVTSMGVVTEVDDDQLALLKRNPVFLMHEKDGFLLVSAKSYAPEKMTADMNRADKSAPITPSDYASGNTRVGGKNDAKPTASMA